MVSIRLKNLTKKFDTGSGTIRAVDDVTLEIEDGEFFTFVGPSGCGKTTTLRMIAGLETPTSGSLLFDDEDVTEMTPQRRDLGMVFQNIILYPHMSVYDNIGYGLKVRDAVDEYDEKIRETAKLLEITPQLEKKPTELSGGQQQRAALGRAIAREPNAILFDEPMSDLDANLKSSLRVELQRLHTEIETTMVYVTHDQEEAMTMSDRIGVMNDGRLAQVGTPEEIFNSPQNVFVSQFIGQPSMNILDAKIKEDWRVTLPDCKTIDGIDLSGAASELADHVSRGDPLRIGFRPQHTHLSTDVESGYFEAGVNVWEPTGAGYNVYLSSNEAELTASTDDVPVESVDDRVSIDHLERLYFFDTDTGERVLDIEPDGPAGPSVSEPN